MYAKTPSQTVLFPEYFILIHPGLSCPVNRDLSFKNCGAANALVKMSAILCGNQAHVGQYYVIKRS